MKVKLSLPESVRLTFQVGLFVFFVVLSFIYFFCLVSGVGFFWYFFVFVLYFQVGLESDYKHALDNECSVHTRRVVLGNLIRPCLYYFAE